MRTFSLQPSDVLVSRSNSPSMDARIPTSCCAKQSGTVLNSGAAHQLFSHPSVEKNRIKFLHDWCDSRHRATFSGTLSRQCSYWMRIELSHKSHRLLAPTSHLFSGQPKFYDKVVRRREKHRDRSRFRHGLSFPRFPRLDGGRTLVHGILDSKASNSQIISSITREEHADLLQKLYDEKNVLFVDETWDIAGQDEGRNTVCLPDEVENKQLSILAAGRVQKSSTRVLVWGGSAAFVQRLCGVLSPETIMAVHLSLSVLAAIKEMKDDIRCCHGSLDDHSASYGQFDVLFLNSIITTVYSLEHLLRSVVSICNPGAKIVISSIQGRENLTEKGVKNPNFVIHELPSKTLLEEMIRSMPLRVLNVQDDPHFYLATLEQGFPMRATSHVVRGLGRGSSKMGIPTANLDPPELSREICELSKGVYFGYTRRCNGADAGVYKMVMNIGVRPTFESGNDVTVEVHILHKFDENFYGEELNIIVLGYIREEMRFNSMGDLLDRIREDIEITQNSLDKDHMTSYAADPFLFQRSREV